MKLYVLYAGDIICRDVAQLNDGISEKSEMALANPIFLIQHSNGWVLWDTGLSDRLVDAKEEIEAWIFHLSMKKTIMEQFLEIGISPTDIDYLVFSHTHNDHTGNAHYFQSATLIMQELEYEQAFNSDNKPSNYMDYAALKTSKVIKLKGDYDLFGDGKIQLISTPGHTVGHQSLLLDLEETGPILISGDIAYYQENYIQQGIPTFNTSKEASLASLQKIEALVKKKNAQLWIQHDKKQFDSLKLSPNYYQ